jgi:hypothetical protein
MPQLQSRDTSQAAQEHPSECAAHHRIQHSPICPYFPFLLFVCHTTSPRLLHLSQNTKFVAPMSFNIGKIWIVFIEFCRRFSDVFTTVLNNNELRELTDCLVSTHK